MKLSYARTLKTLSLSCLCLAFVACNGTSSSNPPAPAANIAPAETSAVSTAITSSGATRVESTVASSTFDSAASGSSGSAMTYEEIVAAHPVLADRAAFLRSVDRVVETDANTFDLYSGGALVMTLAWNTTNNTLSIVNSTTGFTADSIRLNVTSPDQDQKAAISSMMFTMSSCKAQVVEQEQVQGQEQEQDKGAPVQQDKSQEQEQSKEQSKETPKEAIKEECAAIEAVLVLQEVVQKQEQEQSKEQDKSQEQSKEQDKSQEQSKEQDKSQEQSKEQDKSQEQSKEQDKSQDQSKA